MGRSIPSGSSLVFDFLLVAPWGIHWRHCRNYIFGSSIRSSWVSSFHPMPIEPSKMHENLAGKFMSTWCYVDGFCTSNSNRIMSECQNHVDMWSKCGDSKYLLGHTMAYLDWLYCIFIEFYWHPFEPPHPGGSDPKTLRIAWKGKGWFFVVTV